MTSKLTKHTKTKKTPKGFSYTPTQKLPKLKKLPTEWDMKGQYYTSINDKQIEADVVKAEKAYATIVKKFKGTDFTQNPKTLLAVFTAFEKLSNDPAIGKPTRYLSLLTALDSNNEAANKKLNLIGQRLTKAGNALVFFNLELAKTSKENQKKLLASPLLKDYQYDLTCTFENAKYDLTEAEEKILRLTGDCSYGMWVEMTEKILGRKTVTHKGATVPVNEAIDLVNALPFAKKPKLWNDIMQEISTLDEVVENELTAICTKKKITDELRGYATPYTASVIDHEDNEASVEALIASVSSRGFTLSKQFYALKAKLHGAKKITYAQRNAQLGTAPTIDFAQATEICRDVFYGVNNTYGEIFDRLLVNGQIDVYPKKGKRGGAFCWGQTAQPTNVFLNQVDTLRSLETYAHEMGHAIHTERSKTQPSHYQGYSTTTAETASTLFEGLLFDAVFAQSAEKDKVTLLHDKLAGDISTIQRQISFHNFELEMHTIVREQGAITRAELNALMQKHLKAYCGPAIEITELDGHSYIYVGHFRYGFYVYTYAFGQLMSCIMAENFTADNAYASQIDTFLTSGGKDTVANIFSSININTTNAATFDHGLNKMEQEIKLLQKLTTKRL